jgi:hypothetical protein
VLLGIPYPFATFPNIFIKNNIVKVHQKIQHQFNLLVEINKNKDFVIQRLAHFNKIALGKLFFSHFCKNCK